MPDRVHPSSQSGAIVPDRTPFGHHPKPAFGGRHRPGTHLGLGDGIGLPERLADAFLHLLSRRHDGLGIVSAAEVVMRWPSSGPPEAQDGKTTEDDDEQDQIDHGLSVGFRGATVK